MKHFTDSKRYQIPVLTLFTLLGTAQIASAASFEGAATATFGTPNPDFGVEFTGVGTSVFTTGEALSGSSNNVYAVDGLSFSTTEDAQFAIADLSYTNGTTTSGSTVDTVPLDLTLDFTNPSGLSETFTFTFDFNFTPNLTGNPVLDGDTLSVMNVFSNTSFDVGGEPFTLEILGFSNDGGATIGNVFNLPEDDTTAAQLIGQITTAPTSVTPPTPDTPDTPDAPDTPDTPDTATTPEPVSSSALLLLGTGVMIGWKNRKKVGIN